MSNGIFMGVVYLFSIFLAYAVFKAIYETAKEEKPENNKEKFFKGIIGVFIIFILAVVIANTKATSEKVWQYFTFIFIGGSIPVLTGIFGGKKHRD